MQPAKHKRSAAGSAAARCKKAEGRLENPPFRLGRSGTRRCGLAGGRAAAPRSPGLLALSEIDLIKGSARTSAYRRVGRDSELAVHFDTKIAIILDQQLAVWQKANVTAFLVSGITATDPALVGEPYIDGSGNRYLPMCRQPIIVYAADRAGLRRAYERAMVREVERLAIFTHDLFATPHDRANRAAVASVPAAELDFAGIALHADRKTVDKVLDKLSVHP